MPIVNLFLDKEIDYQWINNEAYTLSNFTT